MVRRRVPGRPTPSDTGPGQPGPREASAEAVYGLLVSVFRRMPRDLSLNAVSTLSTLERGGPRRITDLAAIGGITQPSMTTLVTALERSGYVERGSDSRDGRVALVTITSTGRTYIQARRQAGADSLVALIDKLSDDEAAALARAIPALDHLRELESEERDPAPTRPPRAP